MKSKLLRKRTSKFEQAEPPIEYDVQDNKYGEQRNVSKCVIAGREVNFLGHKSWQSGEFLTEKSSCSLTISLSPSMFLFKTADNDIKSKKILIIFNKNGTDSSVDAEVS